MTRTASLDRRTTETSVTVKITLDGTGTTAIDSGIGFFDHMLNLFGRHGLLDLTVTAQGDLAVDGHHTVEDVGIVLGQAIKQALGDKTGIRRYGSAVIPMDEALVMVVLDISGRPYLAFDAELPPGLTGGFDNQLVAEFLRALAVNAGLTLHVRLLAGQNGHHIIESIFKALGRALAEATTLDDRITGVMSTKGVL